MKYEKSFKILEKFKPDAKYHLQNGILWSNVSEIEIGLENQASQELIELGWFLEKVWYRIF